MLHHVILKGYFFLSYDQIPIPCNKTILLRYWTEPWGSGPSTTVKFDSQIGQGGAHSRPEHRCTPLSSVSHHWPHHLNCCSFQRTLCLSRFEKSFAARNLRSSAPGSLCLSSWQTGRSFCSWCWWTRGWGARCSCRPSPRWSPGGTRSRSTAWEGLHRSREKQQGVPIPWTTHPCPCETNGNPSYLDPVKHNTLYKPNCSCYQKLEPSFRAFPNQGTFFSNQRHIWLSQVEKWQLPSHRCCQTPCGAQVCSNKWPRMPRVPRLRTEKEFPIFIKLS